VAKHFTGYIQLFLSGLFVSSGVLLVAGCRLMLRIKRTRAKNE
jgi:hypothetical protein